jgi:hypothetical protein
MKNPTAASVILLTKTLISPGRTKVPTMVISILLRWGVTPLMVTVFTTWQEMSGSGVKTGLTGIITRKLLPAIPRALFPASIDLYGVVPGVMMQISFAVPFGDFSFRLYQVIPVDFASPWNPEEKLRIADFGLRRGSVLHI